MKKYKLLLFDLDETLLGSSWYKKGLAKTLSLHPQTENLDASLFMENKINVPKNVLKQFVDRKLSPDEFRRARWLSAFSYFNLEPAMETIDELNALFVKEGIACIRKNVTLIDLMEDLNKSYELGIVTNALYDPYQKIFHMGLSQLFPASSVIHAEEVGYRKPDPEIFQNALKTFNKEPAQTLFIGDSWIHDVAAPLNFGMDALWLNKKGEKQPDTHQPYAVISNINELRDILL